MTDAAMREDRAEVDRLAERLRTTLGQGEDVLSLGLAFIAASAEPAEEAPRGDV